MDLSNNINGSLFHTELKSYLPRSIQSEKIGMIGNVVFSVLMISEGWRLTVIFISMFIFSLISVLKTKAFQADMLNYANDLEASEQKWKSFYSNSKKRGQLALIISILLFIICNFLSGMTIQDMIYDIYTIILIPSFLIISLLMYTKGFPSLPNVLELAIDH